MAKNDRSHAPIFFRQHERRARAEGGRRSDARAAGGARAARPNRPKKAAARQRRHSHHERRLAAPQRLSERPAAATSAKRRARRRRKKRRRQRIRRRRRCCPAEGGGACGRADGAVQQRVERRAAVSGLQVQARQFPARAPVSTCSPSATHLKLLFGEVGCTPRSCSLASLSLPSGPTRCTATHESSADA